ncbi:Hypothetical predicted protein [Olea europaea subsp. europaea]|uniref:Uncharacterized protein n=1 Tax=Olea europaea subsp. europaea TaxID=158383 RepID=A0A8S0PT20_OLEEU|nr:Hypothetical predicted protein [Olea europaea subsp. europaea]
MLQIVADIIQPDASPVADLSNKELDPEVEGEDEGNNDAEMNLGVLDDHEIVSSQQDGCNAENTRNDINNQDKNATQGARLHMVTQSKV